MTESQFIPSSVHRLAQPHRPNSLVQSEIRRRAGNAQPSITPIDMGKSCSRTSSSIAFNTKNQASVRSIDPAEEALSP